MFDFQREGYLKTTIAPRHSAESILVTALEASLEPALSTLTNVFYSHLDPIVTKSNESPKMLVKSSAPSRLFTATTTKSDSYTLYLRRMPKQKSACYQIPSIYTPKLISLVYGKAQQNYFESYTKE